MNKLHLLFILLIFIGCQKKNKFELPEKIIKNKIQELDSLKNLTPEKIKPITSIDWVTEYSEYIKKQNPTFCLDTTKSLTYWIVPILAIPASSLVKDSINLLMYIDISALTFDDATCFVLEDNIPIATFIINDNIIIPFSPSDFGAYLRDRVVDEIRKSELYFEIAFKQKDGFSHLPGIVFLSKNKFKFLCYDDGNIYPLKEIYRTLYTDEKYLTKLINRIAERDIKFNQSKIK